MTMTQAEALREVITLIDGTRNYRIGSFEFDHSQEPTDVHVNCVRGIKNKIIYRFKVEHVNERGLHILKNDGVSMIDWGGRLCLETDLDPEGNSVNATIEDNAGICIACSVLFQSVLEISSNRAREISSNRARLLARHNTFQRRIGMHSVKREQQGTIYNCVFSYPSKNFDIVESGRVRVDNDDNILEAWGAEGLPFKCEGYEVDIIK